MIVGTRYHFFFILFHTDIDECIEGSLCEQECTNTAGSYNCSCYTGYILANNEISCTSKLLIVFFLLDINALYFYSIDIDECSLGIDSCAQICRDTQGSYSCSCRDGYTLDSNRSGCNGTFVDT